MKNLSIDISDEAWELIQQKALELKTNPSKLIEAWALAYKPSGLSPLGSSEMMEEANKRLKEAQDQAVRIEQLRADFQRIRAKIKDL